MPALSSCCTALLTRPTTLGTGKLHRKYDESLAQIADQQKSGNKLFVLDDSDYAKRVIVERELDRTPDTPPSNVVFDDSSNFIIYPTLLGIKSANSLPPVRMMSEDIPIWCTDTRLQLSTL